MGTADAVLPGYFDQLRAWIERLPEKFNHPSVPPPKATLLCGLPGVGKGTAARVIARTLQRPLFLLDGSIPLNALNRLADANEPFVLWIDQPGHNHTGILRWLQTQNTPTAFVVFTTDAPHKLPAGFARADVVESSWHLDLPDLGQRSGLWGDLLSAMIPGHHEHDSVKLAQLSPMFTAAEIRGAYDNAMREAGGIPDPGVLIDAVLAMRPVALSLDQDLACLRAWARSHARSASSEASCRET
ncbi:MAG: hypothetical protein KDN05_01340 [Verrucomicrobiae bacterium]|nr:hypothetical protein [Verrucomicrobiae bacterium]